MISAKGGAMVKDPVCQKDIDPSEAAAKVEYRGKTYYFCSTACHKAFKADPAKYLRVSSIAAAATATHTPQFRFSP
jgi:Cu+-exporting ATPase